MGRAITVDSEKLQNMFRDAGVMNPVIAALGVENGFPDMIKSAVEATIVAAEAEGVEAEMLKQAKRQQDLSELKSLSREIARSLHDSNRPDEEMITLTDAEVEAAYNRQPLTDDHELSEMERQQLEAQAAAAMGIRTI